MFGEPWGWKIHQNLISTVLRTIRNDTFTMHLVTAKETLDCSCTSLTSCKWSDWSMGVWTARAGRHEAIMPLTTSAECYNSLNGTMFTWSQVTRRILLCIMTTLECSKACIFWVNGKDRIDACCGRWESRCGLMASLTSKILLQPISPNLFLSMLNRPLFCIRPSSVFLWPIVWRRFSLMCGTDNSLNCHGLFPKKVRSTLPNS